MLCFKVMISYFGASRHYPTNRARLRLRPLPPARFDRIGHGWVVGLGGVVDVGDGVHGGDGGHQAQA